MEKRILTGVVFQNISYKTAFSAKEFVVYLNSITLTNSSQ